MFDCCLPNSKHNFFQLYNCEVVVLSQSTWSEALLAVGHLTDVKNLSSPDAWADELTGNMQQPRSHRALRSCACLKSRVQHLSWNLFAMQAKPRRAVQSWLEFSTFAGYTKSQCQWTGFNTHGWLRGVICTDLQASVDRLCWHVDV